MTNKEEEKYYFKYDKGLILSNPNFNAEFRSPKYNSTLARSYPFPNDYSLAEFSNLAYADEYDDLPKNWILLTTATNTSRSNGYFGVAFWNPILNQIVIANRGTQLSNFGSILADLMLTFKQAKTGQSQSAATFAHIIKEEIKNFMSETNIRIQLSITGHSLGAWLAQITTFTIKYFTVNDDKFVEDPQYLSSVHSHTVVFESPGCKQALDKIIQHFIPLYSPRKFGDYSFLDMNVYLSQLNPINSINEHVGIIHSVPTQTHSLKEMIEKFDETTGHISKERILQFKSGIRASLKLILKQLIPLSSTKIYVESVRDSEHTLNVFSENELEFVKDLKYFSHSKFQKILQYRKKHNISDYFIDYDRNVMTGNDLLKTIARIKHLRPSKTDILQLIKDDTNLKVHYEIFKFENQQFRQSLTEFPNYHFKDKYNLKQFLETDKQLLHICVDDKLNVGYELETCILNNVCDFYNKNIPSLKNYFDENLYGFMDWNRLKKVLDIVPDIFDIYEIKLLILVCFEITNEESEKIYKFIKNCKIKLILLSNDRISWKIDKPSVQVSANITFQDLVEESQKYFLQQKYLVLHGKEKSLEDILHISFPLTEEIYMGFHKAIPINVLLELMSTPITEKVVMNCPRKNSLKGIIKTTHFVINSVNEMPKPDDQSIFIIEDNEDSDLLQSYLKTCNEIQKSNIRIEKHINIEEACVQQFDKTIYIFNTSQHTFNLIAIFNRNFYISRNIQHKRTINPLFFINADDNIDIYFISRDKNKLDEYKKKSDVRKFRYAESEKATMKKIDHYDINAHLLRVEKDTITWLYSHGDFDNLRSYILPTKKSVKESDVLLEEDILIISGESGIGKSSYIERIYLDLQNDHWAFIIPLKESNFKNINNQWTYYSIAEFILESCGIFEESYIHHLLSYCLKYKTKLPVCLLFDGYNEIRGANNRKKFMDLVNYLKYKHKVKIVITTRNYRREELENGISVLASYFENFHEISHIADYLVGFWKPQLKFLEEPIREDLLYNNAINLLHNAEEIFGDSISTLIGIPLLLRMIAEVTLPIASQAPNKSKDILSLFENFVKVYYNSYYNSCNFDNANNGKISKDWLLETWLAKHYMLAVAKLFDNTMKPLKLNDMKELNQIGIIRCDPYNIYSFEFCHDSIRDFFVAFALKLWLDFDSDLRNINWDIETFIITEFLLNQEYKEIRYFLNCYLNNFQVNDLRLKSCRSKFKDLWGKDQSQFYIDQDSILHICTEENLQNLVHFIFNITGVTEKSVLLSKRNCNLETPVFISLNSVPDRKHMDMNILKYFLQIISKMDTNQIKTILLSTFLNHFVTEADIRIFEEHCNEYTKIKKNLLKVKNNYEEKDDFLKACKLNNYEEVTKILQQYGDEITKKYFLLVTNEFRETCLHMTTDIKIVKHLLKLKGDYNLQDHHGMTPLSRTIKEENTEVALLCIEKGADVRISDALRYSPLHHAAKRNLTEIVTALLTTKNSIKVDVDCPNAFGVTPLMLVSKTGNESMINLLIKHGANVNSIDLNGMSPLFHAIKANHVHLIKVLKQHGADLNIQDEYGFTPLLFCIQKWKQEAIISLLGNGADVNIGNKRTGYPLNLLIQLDKPKLVKKILKDEVIKHKGAKTIVRKAADLSTLTDTDRDYIKNLPSK